MSKTKEPTAAAPSEPTAPTVLGSAASPEAKEKPSLESRVAALEVRVYGQAPYANAKE